MQEEISGTIATGNDQTIFCSQGNGVMAFAVNQRDEVRDLRDVAGALGAQPGMKQQTFVASGVVTKGNGDCFLSEERHTVFCLQGNGIDRADTAGCNGKGWREDVSYTLNTIDRPAVCAAFKAGQGEKAGGIGYSEEVSPTLSSSPSGTNRTPAILDMSHACDVIRECGGVVPSLQARMGTGGNQVPLTYAASGYGGFRVGIGTLRAEGGDYGGGSENLLATERSLRRLTPLECERLQGFPNGWTDIGAWTDSKGKLHKESSDSARYKAMGNSIALPPWKWVLKRLCTNYERDATLGSLFDGVGGFPLIWSQLNGVGSVKWASEIEEFPIAVTKRHCEEGVI